MAREAWKLSLLTCEMGTFTGPGGLGSGPCSAQALFLAKVGFLLLEAVHRVALGSAWRQADLRSSPAWPLPVG